MNVRCEECGKPKNVPDTPRVPPIPPARGEPLLKGPAELLEEKARAPSNAHDVIIEVLRGLNRDRQFVLAELKNNISRDDVRTNSYWYRTKVDRLKCIDERIDGLVRQALSLTIEFVDGETEG